MPDYECWPLWHHEGDTVGCIDPASLPISSELASDLLEWQKVFDRTLNQSDPANSGFSSDEAETKFIRMGMDLAVRLKAELDCEVAYFDTSTGTITGI